LDSGDIDRLSEVIRAGDSDPQFDLNLDEQVDQHDREAWVRLFANTYFGDAKLDGLFDSSDLIQVFTAAEYEDGIAMNSRWSTGDWNGDGAFATGDLIAAFQDGGYERGLRTANAVPESTPICFVIVSSIVSLKWRLQRSGRCQNT
jgi:hypothetical protein